MPGESRSTGIQTSLLSPLLTETESPFDLEQQWQDLMSIMEMQVSSRWGGVCGKAFAPPGACCCSVEFRFDGCPEHPIPGQSQELGLVAAALVLPQPVW